MQVQNYNREQKSFLHYFQHKCILYVPNFSKIISLEIKNFRARFSKQFEQGKGFLWGSYDLYLFYCRFMQGAEVTEKKIFPRNFSAHLATLPVFMDESFDAERINFIVTESYDTAIEPLFPALFPLMGRFNYLPFKISVEVAGHVYSVFDGASVGQESRHRPEGDGMETTKENTGSAAGSAEIEAETERVAVVADRGDVPGSTVEKAEAEVKEPETIAEKLRKTEKLPAADIEGFEGTKKRLRPTTDKTEAAGVLQAAASFPPDPRYYKKYRLFYEHFFPEKSAGNISKRK